MFGIALLGLATAVFVGVNVGGSAAGESFGPTVGSGVISVRRAGILMAISALTGGVLVGRHVVHTLGSEFVPPSYFTLPASIAVLLFTGLGILLGNVRKVSVSTSETAVGAIAGMGIALGVIDWQTLGVVVTWWIVSPVIAFWLSAVIGRYAYGRIEALLDFDRESRSTAAKLLVLAVACYMGFSAGASNVANAVAPLVGAGLLDLLPATVLGGLAMGIGAIFVGPRTMATVGNEITDLPLEAALIVEVIAATIITLLSWAGIPASLAITAITCVIGLGWGRATRRVSIPKNLGMEELSQADREHIEADTENLFNPATTRRVVTTWIATPTVATGLSYLAFRAVMMLGLMQFP